MKTGINRFAVKGRETSIRVRRERAMRRAAELIPVIEALQAGGAATLQAIADALNERGIPTARGHRWTPTQVSRVRAQADELQRAGSVLQTETQPAGDASRAAERRQAGVTRLILGQDVVQAR